MSTIHFASRAFARNHAAEVRARCLLGRGSQLGPEPLPISVISTCKGLRCPTPEQDSFHSCLDVPKQCLHTAHERGQRLCSRSQQWDEEGRALACTVSLGLSVGTEAESFLPLISLHFLNYGYLASVRKQFNENYRNGLPASSPLREKKMTPNGQLWWWNDRYSLTCIKITIKVKSFVLACQHHQEA